MIHHLWSLVAILKEHGIQVRKICSMDPGMTVYRDEHQIAAIPSRRVDGQLRA